MLNEKYGNPDKNGDGQPDPQWEADHLRYFIPPYEMFWSWSGQKVTKIRVHQKALGPMLTALQEVGVRFDKFQRRKYGLDQCGGVYNFRTIRGDTRNLSTHAYGIAIDLATVQNPLGRRWNPTHYPNMMPREVVDIFEKHGFRWGGKFSRPDCQHFELT